MSYSGNETMIVDFQITDDVYQKNENRSSRLTTIVCLKKWVCLCALILCSWPLHADDAEVLATQLVNPGYQEKPQWFKNSFLDIREDVEEATSEGKRVLLYFYQDGCPYCAKLVTDNFGQIDIAEKTKKHFDTIALNMWGDREVVDFAGMDVTEKEFAKALKVQFTPTLLMLNESGDVVIRINGYFAPNKFSAVLDYVGKKMESQMEIREYLSQNVAQASSGKLHQQPDYLQPPYDFSSRQIKANRPLLVMFEQKKCRVCDELHLDILLRKESLALLEMFDVALLDMWSGTEIRTPQGAVSNAKSWAAQLGVQYSPTMVFFDESGNEVFRTEGYLKSFHIQSAMDYVSSKAYLTQPEFQRYISARADELEAQGIHVDLMN